MEQKGFVYFVANRRSTVLYIGVTNDLKRRISEHAEGSGSIFTGKYRCYKLVYFEVFPNIEQAIAREKLLKRYKRSWKNALVEAINPEWKDLRDSLVDNPSAY